MIKEWNFLRVIACLSIVFLHSITKMRIASGSFPDREHVELFRVFLLYATPAFILLSEIILAHKYSKTIPKHFFSKRIKFLLGPYISFVIIDALLLGYLSNWETDVKGLLIRNLLGGSPGYFILIIFQFYILHYLIVRFEISIKRLMFPSIIIMIIYLLYITQPGFEYEWYWKLPFIGWGGYFVVAYIIGLHYEKIAKLLKMYKWITLIPVFYAGALIFQRFEAGDNMANSIRVDLFPFTIAMVLALLAWGQIFPDNRLVRLISNYSLGIYLLHWQVQTVLSPYVAEVYGSLFRGILVLFLLSLLSSILIIYLISFIPYGKYIIGNTKREFKKIETEQMS